MPKQTILQSQEGANEENKQTNTRKIIF